MMRVIAGRLGGRLFDDPPGNRAHPMAEKVRGALFNVLGDINELVVLDAFMGSGMVSLEAASRGAKSVVAVEIDNNLHSNFLKKLRNPSVGSDDIKAVRANVSSWSDNNQDELFDIVICDPPYDDVKAKLLEKLAKHTKTGGVVVYSLPPTAEFLLPSKGFDLLKQKNYGDATLHFYRRIK